MRFSVAICDNHTGQDIVAYGAATTIILVGVFEFICRGWLSVDN